MPELLPPDPAEPAHATLPTLSVVVAQDGGGSCERCLAAIAGQSADAHEVIVAAAAAESAAVAARHPGVTVVAAPDGLLVPELWGLGMRRASADAVAITTSHFVPSAGWIMAARRALARTGSPAVGGPILPRRDGSASDWAAYFLRYGAYAGYDREQAAHDLPGDNAAYRRAILASHGAPAEDGFWELELHRLLKSEGHALTFVPEMAVAVDGSWGFGPFLRQRLRHGRQFGSDRARAWSTPRRLLAAAALPLIPLLFLRKIVARALGSRRDLLPFLRCSPVLVAFVLAWSAGEAWGYVAGPAQREARS